MENGRGRIWREEVDSPAGEVSSLALDACPLVCRCLPSRGGGTLQMFLVVFPVRSADGAPYPKEGHRNLGDFRESLRGYLPVTPKQPSVGVVIPDRDGE